MRRARGSGGEGWWLKAGGWAGRCGELAGRGGSLAGWAVVRCTGSGRCGRRPGWRPGGAAAGWRTGQAGGRHPFLSRSGTQWERPICVAACRDGRGRLRRPLRVGGAGGEERCGEATTPL